MYTIHVFDISLTKAGFILFLSESENGPTLPVIIGISEAQSITMALNDITPERPLSHDLFRNVMNSLDAVVKKIVISRLENNTFFADIYMNFENKCIIMDARPSDAVALAVRFKAPVFVADAVMQEAGTKLPDTQDEASASLARASLEPTQSATAVILQEKLQQAIKNEAYEDAAILRDQLKSL
ncbi:MAG: bifunctional nuclease family protein [Lentisphaeraceae bacterium]|nr:bifunctional nuclease family protein [Lentisphaeraceae bacterium]